uniref:Uncharacterized protein n=1 Tax=Anguilla anguilla TaxID=7936 RepID=A0A0E9XCP9_ANGAN
MQRPVLKTCPNIKSTSPPETYSPFMSEESDLYTIN